MAKTLCETKDSDKLKDKQKNPQYECKRCGRQARKEKYVCKPKKLS